MLYAATASMLLVLAVLVVYRELVVDVDREDDALLRENALLVDAMLLQPPPDPRQALAHLQSGRLQLGAKRILVRILDGTGGIVVEAPGMEHDLPRSVFPEAVEPRYEGLRGVDCIRDGHPYRLLTAQLQATVLGGPDACVQVALDRGPEDTLLARYRLLFFLVTAPALAISTWLGHRLARRAIAPVEDLAASVARIHADSLDERVVATGLAKELQPVVMSFNDLLARLQQAFDRLRSFSAHLAHELRTPINNLCGEIELALAQPREMPELLDVLRSSHEEAQNLSHIVEGLLFLAYAERPGARIASQPVDVATTVAAVVDYYEAAAQDAGIELSVDAAPGPAFTVDRTMLKRALSNLISNALAFTPRGGRVSVSLGWEQDLPILVVADTGVGIARERLPTIFEGRYRPEEPARSASQRSGLGLGLAIVQSIMKLHHGTVAIESDAGQGCRVTLRFGPPTPTAVPPRAGVEARESGR